MFIYAAAAAATFKKTTHNWMEEEEEANTNEQNKATTTITAVANTHKKVYIKRGRSRVKESKWSRSVYTRSNQHARSFQCVRRNLYILLCCGWLIQVFYWYTPSWIDFFFFVYFYISWALRLLFFWNITPVGNRILRFFLVKLTTFFGFLCVNRMKSGLKFCMNENQRKKIDVNQRNGNRQTTSFVYDILHVVCFVFFFFWKFPDT